MPESKSVKKTLREIADEFRDPQKAIQYIKENCKPLSPNERLIGVVIYPIRKSEYRGNVEIVIFDPNEKTTSGYLNIPVNIPPKGECGLPWRFDDGTIIGMWNKPNEDEWAFKYPPNTFLE